MTLGELQDKLRALADVEFRAHMAVSNYNDLLSRGDSDKAALNEVLAQRDKMRAEVIA